MAYLALNERDFHDYYHDPQDGAIPGSISESVDGDEWSLQGL